MNLSILLFLLAFFSFAAMIWFPASGLAPLLTTQNIGLNQTIGVDATVSVQVIRAQSYVLTQLVFLMVGIIATALGVVFVWR